MAPKDCEWEEPMWKESSRASLELPRTMRAYLSHGTLIHFREQASETKESPERLEDNSEEN